MILIDKGEVTPATPTSPLPCSGREGGQAGGAQEEGGRQPGQARIQKRAADGWAGGVLVAASDAPTQQRHKMFRGRNAASVLPG